MKRLAAAAALAASLAFAAPAPAAHTGEHAIAIADAWVAQAAPGHVNHCAGGRLDRLTFSPDLGYTEDGRQILGLANGYVLRNNVWVWDPTACRIELLSTLDRGMRCWVYAHEVMHYAIGVEHIGPLDPSNPGAVDCFYSLAEPEVTQNADTPREVARKAHRRVHRSRRACVSRRAPRVRPRCKRGIVRAGVRRGVRGRAPVGR